MKKTIVGLLVAAVLVSGTSLFSETIEVSVSPAPKVINVVGDTAASYAPTTWPEFGASVSDNESCASGLRAMSGKYKSGIPTPKVIMSKAVGFEQLGLSRYKTTAKVIVSWTVRIEAAQVFINPWTSGLCSPWHGTIEENFPGGEVDTMLYLNGKKVGNTATMTFPSLGKGSNTNISDPTITNSVTLSPSDFANGQIPAAFELDIRWVNKTIGSSITAPAFMRNMTIFIIPVGS